MKVLELITNLLNLVKENQVTLDTDVVFTQNLQSSDDEQEVNFVEVDDDQITLATYNE